MGKIKLMHRRLFLGLAFAALPCMAAADEACSANSPRLHVPSPAWQEQVIYMLFIDRFQDGDASNNDQGHGEYDPASGAHFSGGDIRGIIKRLDYLQTLGVTALWLSPPVANQWWSTPYRAAGWHGYWAVNFRQIDKHFGTLGDYKRLSHELHCRGMYLIQDIVANHTANFYTYDGGYDPADTARNFRLLEPDSHQPAPTQPPFHLIDRRNPEHAAANIYHWTPTIQDYADRYQETNHMLGQLADLNTENPVVIDALKDTYKYWIGEAGVDAFRVDTVMLVEHEFWNRFLHDDDGIYRHAQSLGKDHFLTFGESVSVSDPYRDDGEKKLKGYIGSREKPYLNSMLGYPLYFEIARVVGRGQPTSQLAYRLERFMSLFADPFSIPNFIDNHDTPRFLATGHTAAFEQALALLFTIPGIPIIYQGTEQALKETRQAMFKGGFHNERGSFDRDSTAYRLIGTLSELRRSNPILTRGKLKILASDSAGPGLLAYQRTLDGRSITVLMNTADHSVLAHQLRLGTRPGEVLKAALLSQAGATREGLVRPQPRPPRADWDNADGLITAGTGLVTTVLPARTVFISHVHDGPAALSPTDKDLQPPVNRTFPQRRASPAPPPPTTSEPPEATTAHKRPYRSTGRQTPRRRAGHGDPPPSATVQPPRGETALQRPANRAHPPPIRITHPASGGTYSDTFRLAGHAHHRSELQLIRNGNMDSRIAFQTDNAGAWEIDIPVVDFGRMENHLQVYDTESDWLSERIFYTGEVLRPTLDATFKDPANDDTGPTGKYIKPQQPESRRQKDILGARVRSAGRNLELTLTLGEVSTNWLPPNGFDNVVFSIFIDTDPGSGINVLPRLNARMPPHSRWNLAHVASGWASYLYNINNARPNEQGDKLGIAPRIASDPDTGTVTFFYEGKRLGIESWNGTAFYITTWEHSPEGEYTDISPAPSDWSFGGALPQSPKVLDDLLIRVR